MLPSRSALKRQELFGERVSRAAVRPIDDMFDHLGPRRRPQVGWNHSQSLVSNWHVSNILLGPPKVQFGSECGQVRWPALHVLEIGVAPDADRPGMMLGGPSVAPLPLC